MGNVRFLPLYQNFQSCVISLLPDNMSMIIISEDIFYPCLCLQQQ